MSLYFCKFRIWLLVRLRQTLRFQPIVKVVDPVIARFSLFAHTPAMTAGGIDVKFRFVSSGLESIVEGDDVRAGECIVLGHRHEKRR